MNIKTLIALLALTLSAFSYANEGTGRGGGGKGYLTLLKETYLLQDRNNCDALELVKMNYSFEKDSNVDATHSYNFEGCLDDVECEKIASGCGLSGKTIH